MSHDITDFLPLHPISGKFFSIEVDKLDAPFFFRCYYDFSEFEDVSPSDLRIFQYEEGGNSWKEVPILISNSSLRYFEVELQEDYTLLRLGEKLIHITYNFLPFVFLFTLIIVLLISLMLIDNQQMAKYVKRMYK